MEYFAAEITGYHTGTLYFTFTSNTASVFNMEVFIQHAANFYMANRVGHVGTSRYLTMLYNMQPDTHSVNIVFDNLNITEKTTETELKINGNTDLTTRQNASTFPR